jgi:hypothetical protein
MKKSFLQMLIFCWTAFVCIAASGSVWAQQAQPSLSSAQTNENSDNLDGVLPIRRKHSSVSRPAEFQGPGILQMEYGYDGNFRSRDLRADQSGSLSLSFPATEWLLLEFGMDTILAQTDRSGLSAKGGGDTHVGFQLTAIEDNKQHPSIAFAYLVKLPSASEAKGLGTGRVDHQILALVSKKIGEMELDCSLGLLINGRELQSGHLKGGQFAFGLSRDIGHGFGLQGEVSGQNLDADQPHGVFALAALTYQSSRRIIFDLGTRFGLNSIAPDFGVFAGVSIGIVNLYK